MRDKTPLVFALFAAAACQEAARSGPTDPALKELLGATRIEIYALDLLDTRDRPASAPPLDASRVFHECEILGRADLVAPAQRERLVSLLQRGFDENDTKVGKCWSPRHGVHAEFAEGTVDLVVCFQCLHAYVYDSRSNAGASRHELIADSVEPEVTQIYRALGLRIAD
jgi:hypothetical protein